MPTPGGPGTGPGSYSVYVQVPDTLALNGNSRVMVADVFVGRVRAMNIKNWVATLTLDLNKDVRLPKNATAKIGQTSLLGSQHIELAAPPDASPQPLKAGDTIPLRNSSSYPTIERVLASVSLVLNGGHLANLEVLQNEVYDILNGRGDQIRGFLDKLATFTNQFNQQRDDVDRAIDSADHLLGYVAGQDSTLDRAMVEFPKLIKHFADTRDQFVNAVEAMGRLSSATDKAFSAAHTDLAHSLQSAQRPLKQLGLSAPYLLDGLKWILTQPFPMENVDKLVRGDYINASALIDLSYSTLDNGWLTGTGLSGALRALEQSFGRDTNNMDPDVRYTPNLADVQPERGE